MEYLITALNEGEESFGYLKAETAQKFIEKSDGDASPSQQGCLTALPLTAIYGCIKFFHCWVDKGYYDFNTVPFALKKHLVGQDQLALGDLLFNWTSMHTLSGLAEQLKQLIDVLKHSQQDIIDQVSKKISVRLIE